MSEFSQSRKLVDNVIITVVVVRLGNYLVDSVQKITGNKNWWFR